MNLAFFQGRSFVSRLIKFVTWGKYSHVAVILDDGRILEAWHKPNGVRWISHLGDGHLPGTLVDIFDVPALPFPEAARIAAESLIGRPYDFWGILGFVLRRRIHSRAKWFCSEAAAFIIKSGGWSLLTGVPPHKTSPSLLSTSALLTLYGWAITGKTRTVIHKFNAGPSERQASAIVPSAVREPGWTGDWPVPAHISTASATPNDSKTLPQAVTSATNHGTDNAETSPAQPVAIHSSPSDNTADAMDLLKRETKRCELCDADTELCEEEAEPGMTAKEMDEIAKIIGTKPEGKR